MSAALGVQVLAAFVVGQGASDLLFGDGDELVEVAGRVQPITTREVLQGMQLESPVTHRVTIRYRTDVTAAMSVLWGSVRLNIRGVRNPDERKRYTELLCDQGVAV